MMDLPIYNLQGERVGIYILPDEFIQIELNIPLLHQVVTAYLANRRQGTHSSLRRGEVSGGGKKPWRQKGTGRARQGSIRAPQWKGGGIVKGPKPVDYNQKLNKRVRKTAIKMAWCSKLMEGQVFLVEGLNEFDRPKIKPLKDLLERLGLSQKKVLLLLEDRNAMTLKSVDNLPNVDKLPILQPCTYDLLTHNAILTSPQAFKSVVERRFAKANVR